MTKFKKFTCNRCGHTQLEPNKSEDLIRRIVCRNCWHQETLCNILGSK
jgi:transcription elongation factor Elf1